MIESSADEDVVKENPGDRMVRYFCWRKWQDGPAYINTDTSSPQWAIYDFNGRYKKLIEDKNGTWNP
jgi:hypothetical protein